MIITWAALAGSIPTILLRILSDSVQFSLSIVSDSLWPHEPQHEDKARPTKIIQIFNQILANKGRVHALVSQFSSVQLLSRVRLLATPWITARQASLSITNSRSSLRLTSIESVMPSSHLILGCPLLLLLPILPSIRVFSNESTLHMGLPKYWSFSFSISLSNEHPGLVSFRMDWLDLLAVQGTYKSLLQHHSSKASILQHSGFFLLCNSHIHAWPQEKP